MGFFVEDSCLLVTHVLYQAAVVLAVLRWGLSWFRNRTHLPDTSSHNDSLQLHLPSSDHIRECLTLTTFGDANDRQDAVCERCAVCLGEFRGSDEVRELRNCRHVFHRDCIDRWVEHEDDNHKTCPLCRAPLLTTSQCLAWSSQPSWAVERILYLFGDDLHT